MKGLYVILALLAVVGLASCTTSNSRVTSDTTGEAYKDIDNIYTLHIMPVEMPDEIHGNATESDKERWQEDWSMVGARLIAKAVTDESGERITAIVSEEKPDTDFYFELVITYLDVGDDEARSINPFNKDEVGWSHVLAVGTLYRSSSGDVVAELKFDQSSGYATKEPFQSDMDNLGRDLSSWIAARQ